MQRWLEVLSASTSSAVATQEGAMDSPEMQQDSPRQKCTLSGQRNTFWSTAASGKTDQTLVCLFFGAVWVPVNSECAGEEDGKAHYFLQEKVVPLSDACCARERMAQRAKCWLGNRSYPAHSCGLCKLYSSGLDLEVTFMGNLGCESCAEILPKPCQVP